VSLGFYTGILADQRRIDGVREGLAQAVHPGDKVLEVGTGLGTFAFFAVQAGADHVWAVDRDPVIHVAEMLAKTNGLHDRITFLRGEMSEIALPDQVDLLVFEDFAVRLLDDRMW
jgi:protein arginine N-methyltransferase 3